MSEVCHLCISRQAEKNLCELFCFYIENIDSSFSRFLDLNGTELILPGCGEEGFIPYGYIIIEEDSTTPF